MRLDGERVEQQPNNRWYASWRRSSGSRDNLYSWLLTR